MEPGPESVRSGASGAQNLTAVAVEGHQRKQETKNVRDVAAPAIYIDDDPEDLFPLRAGVCG